MDVVVADIADDASLEAMCGATSVLISCVGPVSDWVGRLQSCVCVCVCYAVFVTPYSQYQLYGEPVIKACIKAKCNYVDITGEPYVS